MKLTLKKLVWITMVSLILTVIKVAMDDKFGNWVSPKDVKFWVNDIAVIIAWILYFVENKKK